MPHPDEPALVSYVAEHSSGVALAVYDASDQAGVRAALQKAAAEICQIRHPDEPDEALPNWCAVLDEDGVAVLRLDMKDEIRYSALVVRIVLAQLTSAGVDGRLEPKRRPEAAFEYDANADLYAGMEPLAELGERGLPPGFPAGFPIPGEATLVQAERCRDGMAEHAAWRGSGPFTGYLERLRTYGCVFGPVPRLLTVEDGVAGTVRYTLWRDGAGGSVWLYRHEPRHWYVSVVWQPHAQPPATPVDPDEAPDARPVPTGQPAARELAEFLVPTPLVTGYETVVALATVSRALGRLVDARPGRGVPRAKPPEVASALVPVLGKLTPGQQSLVRHVCLTMVANVLASGRRPRPAGLTLVPDGDGQLYAADVRERMRDAVERDLIPSFETALALVQGAPMLVEALSGIRNAPVRPPAGRYAWLFAGLDPGHLAAARDACWRIFET